MASTFLHRVTDYLRRIDGTRAEPVRNALLAVTGAACDLVFALTSRGRNGHLHPLAAIVSRQVGEPRERWDLTNLPGLRSKSSDLMAYLPSGTQSSPVRVRLAGTEGLDACYLPSDAPQANPRSVVVYLHGGGFVLGDAESVLPEADVIGGYTSVDVYVLDYPLSPEAVFPTALDRVGNALRSIGEMYQHIVLVGESAGANIAASVVLRDALIRERVKGLVFLYGWMDLRLDSRSHHRLGKGHVLTTAILDWFADQYTQNNQSLRKDPEVSPLLHPDLSCLPPALCIVGEFDPLLDDMIGIHKAVPNSQLRVVRGMVHGFLQFRTVYRKRIPILRAISEFIYQRLGETSS